jgi:Fe-S cluster assembly iron-binding protein IscA
MSMTVTLSDKAAKHVANYLVKRGKGIGLRLGVRTSGCSGMAYKLEFVDEVSPGDDWSSRAMASRSSSTPKACLILTGWNSTMPARA